MEEGHGGEGAKRERETTAPRNKRAAQSVYERRRIICFCQRVDAPHTHPQASETLFFLEGGGKGGAAWETEVHLPPLPLIFTARADSGSYVV